MSNWDDIRYFLAVARQGSVSGAAKALNVNHSTVSRRIAGLEKSHGVQLFNRVRDGYEMSEAAFGIYEQAQAIEKQNLQISRTLFGEDSRLEGPINLTMPHDIFEYCLSEELALFQKKHPGIHLNLAVTKGVRNLASREADIAIRLTPEPPDYLVGRQVAGLQHGIYGAKHEVADLMKEGMISSEEVSLVVWSGQQGLPHWAEQYFPLAKIALQVDDLTTMYAAVKAGFGLARMPCYLPDSLNDPLLAKLDIPVLRSDWSVWVLNHVDLRKTARVQKLRHFLLEALQSKKALFEGLSV